MPVKDNVLSLNSTLLNQNKIMDSTKKPNGKIGKKNGQRNNGLSAHDKKKARRQIITELDVEHKLSQQSKNNTNDFKSNNTQNNNNNDNKDTQKSNVNNNKDDKLLDDIILRKIKVEEFAQSRAFEIASMQSSLRKDTEHAGQLRVFQTVPRHMRRRAASHNVKRLPKRIRQRALAQVERDTGNPQQKPKMSKKHKMTILSRRKKRRLNIILKNFDIREALKFNINNNKYSAEIESMKRIWLETHLWHSKRSKMIHLWGYKLPLHPNDKSFRSSFRATKLSSLLIDTSFECVFELNGLIEDINKLMEKFIDPTLPLLSSSKYINGDIQGIQHFYETYSYPINYIGPFKFLLCPKELNNENRKLWIWIHPSIRVIIFNLLKDSCQNTSIKLKNISNELGSFTLKGPRTQAVLQYVLQLVATEEYENQFSHLTWKNYLNRLRTPGSLKSGSVLGLTINDPRLHVITNKKMPSREVELDITKNQLNGINNLSKYWAKLPFEIAKEMYSIKDNDISKENFVLPLHNSDIWNPEIRKNIRNNKLSDDEINKRRQKLNVLGDDLTPDYTKLNDPKIPILLIRNLDSGINNNYSQSSSGWTIIFPAGYGKDLWLNLVFSAGCRIGGLRELKSSAFEDNKLSFPYDYPETKAYDLYSFRYGGELWSKWLRTPKGKRIEYENNANNIFIKDYSLLESKNKNKEMKLLDEEIDNVFNNNKNKSKHFEDIQRQLPQGIVDYNSEKSKIMSINSPWIIRYIKNEIIKNHKIKNNLKNKINKEEVFKYWIELLKIGRNQEYLDQLKYLNLKYNLLPIFIHISLSFENGGHPTDLDIIYKPPLEKTIKNSIKQCNSEQDKIELEINDEDLQEIGYITQGDISYSRSHGLSFGMIKLTSLSELAWLKKNNSNFIGKVLVKSPNGFKYHWANITLLNDI